MENSQTKPKRKIFLDTSVILALLTAREVNDIDEYAKISDDGKSLFIRVPAKIKKTFNIQKGQYLRFHSKIKDHKKGELVISIVNENDINKIKKDREKQALDYKDLMILKAMIENGAGDNVWLTTNEISKLAKLNWKTVDKHLGKIDKEYSIENRVVGEVRNFKRDGKKVKSERQKEWKLTVPQI